MRIVALVPIKIESERVPFKNIRKLGHQALCKYILDTLSMVKEIDDIYVYCSSPRIKEYLPERVKFLERPKKLDEPGTLGMDIYQSFADRVPADYYLLCHATSPYLKSSSIETGIRAIQAGYDSAFAVIKKKTFAWFKSVPLNYSLRHVPRTQEITPVFLETSAYYLFSSRTLLDGKRIGDNPFMVETSDIEAIDIDEEADFALAERLYPTYLSTL